MLYRIAALYRFTPIADTAALRAELLREFASLDLCGSLLLAGEGINGTLAGSETAIDHMLEILAAKTGMPRADVKFSHADEKPFNKLKIRLKREIITFNQPQADPNILAGQYIEAKDWNSLLDDPEVTLLDTRNKYESLIGSFDGADIPPIDTFTEFADYVRENFDPTKQKKIAMFCTGGIRCEKASAFMRAEGFEEVYHLKGGILKYLETIPPKESKYNGDCYVFDRRVAVGHGLATGQYGMCFSCGYPLEESDKAHPHFEEGVSCRHCFAATGEDDKARFRMRQTQVDAANN